MIVLLALSAAHATEAKGFAELRGSYAVGVDGRPWTLVQRVRPTVEVDLGEHVVLGTTVEAAVSEGRYLQDELARTLQESDAGPMLELAGCSWPQVGNDVFHVDEASDVFLVDRLYVDVYSTKVDLRVGRQALQWGSAMMINPTDPFPQVLFVEPWRFRAGVNAVRANIPFGTKSNQVQAVAAIDDTLTYGRAAVRGTVDVGGTDVSLMGAYRGDARSAIAGLDVKGTLGVGYWFEGAMHVDDLGADGTPTAWEEFAVGFDYSFPVGETLLVGAQYYRNGAGAADVDDYALVARTSTGIAAPDCADPGVEQALSGGKTDAFAPFFVGKDYALAQVSFKATQDLSFSAVGLQNLRDGTGMAVPVVSVMPLANLEIGGTAQVPYRMWGRRGEFKPAPQDLVMDLGSGLGGDLNVDLNGMVPDATFTLWAKASF